MTNPPPRGKFTPMTLQMRWVGESDWEHVAQTRAGCYGSASKDLPKFQESLQADGRAKAGDFLLAEQSGVAVGTATSLSLSMWMRGAKIPCQGVAWVGTIKTHRRGASTKGEGIASQIMRETLRLAREREQVVSALMPFRGSFYEHFGYGIVERHCTWTVPLAVLPTGPFDGIRFYRNEDRAALARCRQRQVESGQCDIERSDPGWNVYLKKWEDGLIAVDSLQDGTIQGYAAFQQSQKNEKDYLHVTEACYQDATGLRRLLHFLSSLRDQYTFATLTLPADLPLNRILREPQIPHRLVNHPHAEVRPYTRMQLRILNHKRLIESMRFSNSGGARAVVQIHESEGHSSRFVIEWSEGHAEVSDSQATPDFECTDRTWAAMVSGDLKASVALEWGLANARVPGIAKILDVLAEGPLPFCQEYF